ncbi:hypothetical protein CSW08_15945 [Confluentibacter flavum]|uniref:Uncharacterized protein n=1 Tax=Confluentibacter flavum TaxID=1909700 RepID=A0A2N3HG09_9FLAO|nr:hypothetical protein CSW08_15945 [Confluentibacter flavum]
MINSGNSLSNAIKHLFTNPGTTTHFLRTKVAFLFVNKESKIFGVKAKSNLKRVLSFDIMIIPLFPKA